MPEHSKVFDQSFKGLPEASPRGFAEVMGLLQPGEEAEVELLPQEISVPTVSMDAGLIVRSKDPFVAIFEAFGSRPDRALGQVLEYAKGADTKFDLPIRVYLVPLVERACPRDPPPVATRLKGDYRVEVGLRWIRPWEIDAGMLLAQERPEFTAWTPLFRATPEQEVEAVNRLRRVPGQLARFRILGGLRYRGEEAAFWHTFVERVNRMLTKEDLRESLAVQEWLEEGRQEGFQEGLKLGLQEAGAHILRRAVARFPGLDLPPVLPASIDLVDLAEEIMAAPNEIAARARLASRGL